MNIQSNDIRAVLLKTIHALRPRGAGENLQSGSVLAKAAADLGIRGKAEHEEALLTQFYEFFRTGYLAWGYNLSNPNPPFFHLTEQGMRTLAQLSGDPGNPQGYLERINAIANINPIARSYLEEALQCYVGGLHKACAVMIGGAAESVIIELRDAVDNRLSSIGKTAPKELSDWRIAQVLAGLKVQLDASARQMPHELRAEYASFWTAFTQQIRATRNDAGHPSSVDPITADTVHASLLIFPELLKLAGGLRKWVEASMT